MTHSVPRHLAAIPPSKTEKPRHIDPTMPQRAAADALLRGQSVPAGLEALVERTVAELDEVERFYLQEGRRRGEGTQVWDTAGWMIANAIARIAADEQHRQATDP